MTRYISFAVLLAFIVLIGALFYKVMIGFIVPIFLAAVLVVVFRPLHRWVLQKCNNRERFAAALTTGLVLLIVLVPAALMLTTAAIQATELFNNFNPARASLALSKARRSLNLEMEYPESIGSLQKEMEQLQAEAARWDSTTAFSEIADDKNQFAGLVRRIDREIRDLIGEVKDNKDERPIDFDALGLAVESLRSPFAVANSTSPVGAGESTKTAAIDLLDLQSRVVNLSQTWEETRINLLGGSTRAFFKELANPSEEKRNELQNNFFEYLQPKLLSLTSATGIFALQLFFGVSIMLVALYFFLYDGPGMVKAFMRLSPLDDRYEQELLNEFDRTARAVVLATLLSALVQGLVAGVGYYFAGVPALVFLTLFTAVCALIPFVGPAIVWVPVCLWLGLYEEQWLAAGLLAGWGTIVVGSSDNLVKAFVLHGQSSLHPLLALLSVLGGVQSLGPIGIVVGPMAVTMLQTLLGILQNEMAQFDNRDPSLAGTEFDSAVPAGTTVGGQIFSAFGKKPVSAKNSGVSNKQTVDDGDSSEAADGDAGKANQLDSPSDSSAKSPNDSMES
jgi:predicted PurR-regulated permease PerM